MSNNFGSIDIILLAMIAGFIILRLRNILGRKTGHQDKVFSGFEEKTYKDFKNKNIKTNIETKLSEDFKKEEFLKGAELAYESIITSFASGDKKKLKSLLSTEMNLSFEEAINQRQKEDIKSELTFIGFKESNLEKFDKIKNDLYATVKFVCEIISVKRDKENNIIEGNPDKIKVVTDYWRFSKHANSKNPNWHLCEIINK